MTKVYRTLKKREKIIKKLAKKGFKLRSLGFGMEIFENKQTGKEVYLIRG